MAITNQERVGKAMDLLRAGLAPFVEREVQSSVKAGTVRMDAVRRFADDPMLGNKPIAQWDVAGLLKLMWETWNDVFGRTLGRAERSLVQELRDWRNKWAHQEPFSSDDTDRALDSMSRPVTKPHGTVVRTLWGELAWQLGGPKAFARIAKDDEAPATCCVNSSSNMALA
jgi:hypothetical protein